jgi:hypothetical protein
MLVTAFNNFVKQIFTRRKQSIWIAVLGKKQSGKTDFCLHLIEKCNELGLMDAFGSNVPVEANFPIDFIEDFETLDKRCKMLNPEPQKRGFKRYLFFGSEMGKWLPKDEAWRNTKFIGKLQTVRKNGLSWIGDAIDRVEGRALNPTHFEGCFNKLSPTNPKIANYENWVTGEIIDLENIPRTKIKFDTWYSANFYMEPQGAIDAIPLDPNAQIVKAYLDNGCSWKKAGIETKKGKRAMISIAEAYLRHYGHYTQDPLENTAISEPSKEIKEEFA